MNTQLSTTLQNQIETCKEAIGQLYKRYQNGKIDRDSYVSKLNLWEERMYSANLKLDSLEK